MGYQERDWEIADYHLFKLDGYDTRLRGPKPPSLEKNKYFVCLGAAQTFGVLCEKPYPTLLSEKLNLPVLNLGVGGAGPSLFINNKILIDYINNARFVVIQVMSGRSESNSLFNGQGVALFKSIRNGAQVGANVAYSELLQLKSHDYVKGIIEETRANWVANNKKLMNLIRVPKVLFWFSVRKPDYQESYTNVHQLFGDFPQLVNQEMMDEVKRYSDEYVESVSKRGMPQLLISRFTGKPTTINQGNARKDLAGKDQTHNLYYPSPEMQIDAFNALEPVCLSLLNNHVTVPKFHNVNELNKLATDFRNKFKLNYQNNFNQGDDEAWNYFKLGNTFVEQNRMSEAETSYRRAIGLNPKEFHFFLQLAAVVSKQGDEQKSTAFYHKAIQLNPDLVSKTKELTLAT